MPLVPCPDCQNKLSTSARSCPRCGRPGPFGEVAPPWSQAPAEYPAPAYPPAGHSGYPSAPYPTAGAPGHAPVAYAPAPRPPEEETECPFCRLRMKNRTICYRCETRLVPPNFLSPHRFPRLPVSYAGFGQRLGAMVIDMLVLLPVTALVYWLQSSPAGAIFGSVLSLVVFNGYHIVLVATRGQTVGKLAMDIQVRRADGAKAGWGAAFIRRMPDLLLSVVLTLATVQAVAALTQADFDFADDLMRRMKMMAAALPAWTGLVNVLFGCFRIADVITFFCNPRNRALHDYIADTVVVEA
jgi:uncharacterized RDD family membrane protein YckC